MAELVTLVDNQLVAEVDELVAHHVVASRSEAVRIGLEQLVDQTHRAKVAIKILDGYRRYPQDETAINPGDAAARAMIEEEPW
jgi:Arc/MetJ-type ribon-helix-helix transcriptional regulator